MAAEAHMQILQPLLEVPVAVPVAVPAQDAVNHTLRFLRNRVADLEEQAVVIEARAIYWTNRAADEIVAHTATMRRLMTAVER